MPENSGGMTNQKGERTVLDVFVEPRAYAAAFAKSARWGLAAVMIALFFVLTAASSWVVLQDEDLVAQYTETMMHKPPDGMARERLEEIRETTRAALAMPGMTVILSLVTSASTMLHLIMTWSVIVCGVALVMKERTALGLVVLVAAASLPILMLGRVVNLLLRLAFRDLTAVAGILPVVGARGGASLAGFLTGSIDVFVIWYLAVVAFGISASTALTAGKALILVFALWVAVLLCSFLLGQGAGWTM